MKFTLETFRNAAADSIHAWYLASIITSVIITIACKIVQCISMVTADFREHVMHFIHSNADSQLNTYLYFWYSYVDR